MRKGLLWVGGAALFGLMLLPLVGLGLSLVQGGVHSAWAWLERPGGLALLGRSLALASLVTLLIVPAGALLAWLEMRCHRPRWMPPWWLALLPLAMPSYVLAGALREQLGPAGVGGLWSASPFSGFWAAVLVLAVATLPYVHLLVSAALGRSSASEEEAALLLGASSWTRFRSITLPRIRPALGVAALLGALYVLGDFGAVAVLDCEVLTWRLYQSVQHQRLDEAAGQGLALLLFALPLVIWALRIRRIADSRTVANPRPIAKEKASAKILLPGLVVYGLMLALGLILPLATLFEWLLDGWRRKLAFASLWEPLGDSLGVAVWGTLLTVAMAMVPAWASARWSGKAGRWMELTLFATSSLPGILLAFGLLLAALFLADGDAARYRALQAGGILLVLAYALRFLSEAFSAMRSSMVQVDSRQLEAARMLPASRARRWGRVLLPAIAPGLSAAALLVFVAILKELPITLLLGSGLGLRNLSFRIYDRYNEAFLHDAAAAALLLLLASFLALSLTLRWRRHV